MKLPVSVSSDFYGNLSPEETVDAFLDAGFGCMELGIGHSKRLLARQGSPERLGMEFAAYAADKGFAMPQGHIELELDICDPKDVDTLKIWLDLFCGAGVKAAVLHATGALEASYERQLELRSATLRQMNDYLAGTDMVICLENLFSKPMVRDVDGINELIEASGGGAHLGICLDIGHLHRTRSHGLTQQTSAEFIRKAGSRLKALHIHDNHGVTDDHLLPFTHNGLDWKAFMKALSESGYEGLFNLEIHTESYGVPHAVRSMKLGYVRELAGYLLSEEFICG